MSKDICQIDVTAQGRELLIQQYKTSPRLAALIDGLLTLVQRELIDPLCELQRCFRVADATGVWLDYLGLRLGYTRPTVALPQIFFGFDVTGWSGYDATQHSLNAGFDLAPFFPTFAQLRLQQNVSDTYYRNLLAGRALFLRSDGSIRAVEATLADLFEGGGVAVEAAGLIEAVVLEESRPHFFDLVKAGAEGLIPKPAGVALRLVRLEAPDNVVALVDDRQVLLRWDTPNGRVRFGYEYRQSDDGGSTWAPDWTEMVDSDKDTTEYAVTGLTNGTAYTFEVRTMHGLASDRVTATPQAPVVDAVQFEGNGPYGLDDDIAPSVCFTGTVTVTGTPQLALEIRNNTVYGSRIFIRQADYDSLTTYESEGLIITILYFSYTVVAADSDGEGVSIAADALTLNGGSITGIGGTAATLTIPNTLVITNDSSQTVDGGG